MSAAAKAGNLGVLEWAHANGCPMSANTMNVAAFHGQLAPMKWLRSHGCPVTPTSIVKAAANAQQAALVWLVEELAVPFESATRGKARAALLRARDKSRGASGKAAELYRRTLTLDATGAAKGYW